MWTLTLGLLIALNTQVPAGGGPVVHSGEGVTALGDLQIAYNIERNAQKQYEVYAHQADLEGYHGVASLFRAAMRGEEVHAALHAAAIQELCGKPTASVEPVIIRSTRSNLSSAIAEESYERDKMYRMFTRRARDEGCEAAVTSCTRAREAETTHAALFREALDNLSQMKDEQAFYVCPGCGSAAIEPEGNQCQGCGGPATELERIL